MSERCKPYCDITLMEAPVAPGGYFECPECFSRFGTDSVAMLSAWRIEKRALDARVRELEAELAGYQRRDGEEREAVVDAHVGAFIRRERENQDRKS